MTFQWDVDRWGLGEQHRIVAGLSAGLLGIAFEEVLALVELLIMTPDVHPRLSDAARARRLIADLKAQSSILLLDRHGVVAEPLMGDRLDLHLTIERILREVWPRRIRSRPIRGEPVPDPASLVPRVRRELPAWVRGSVTDEQILHRLEAMTAVEPWPFTALTD